MLYPDISEDVESALSKVALAQKVRFYLQALARELLPVERVALCLRSIAPHKRAVGVDVMFSRAVQRARFRNLIVCSRLWMCAVCAARITEGRRKELTTALAAWPGKVIMVTFTMRHQVGDSFDELLNAILAAFLAVIGGKQWQAIKDRYGLAGFVRALEVTYGDHGWHPHLHVLFFLEPEAMIPACVFEGLTLESVIVLLGAEMKKRWLHMLANQGQDASYERGVDVRAADDFIREYVAKYGHEPLNPGWTVEREVTKGPSKVGNDERHGKPLFQLLTDYGDGDQDAGRHFVEAVMTLKRHKTAQLHWSRGFKKRLQAEMQVEVDSSDQELASAPLSEDEELLLNLTPGQWRVVLLRDLRAGLLDVARQGDDQAVWSWLYAKQVPHLDNLEQLMNEGLERRRKSKP